MSRVVAGIALATGGSSARQGRAMASRRATEKNFMRGSEETLARAGWQLTSPAPPRKFPMKNLRIAQVAPLWTRIPPATYGGIELLMKLLIDELVARGHDVTL